LLHIKANFLQVENGLAKFVGTVHTSAILGMAMFRRKPAVLHISNQ
jgi:hypothetical protein